MMLDKRVLVVGAGLSGLSASKYLQNRGACVFLTDKKELAALTQAALPALPADRLILGREPDLDDLRPDFIVLSPGVPPTLPFLRKAMSQGIPLLSEVELALADCPAQIIGITGSNGKTTTTTLTGALIEGAAVAGNIGLPLSDIAPSLTATDILVAEFSSFQLEFISTLHVHIAAILNLTPDHLDRHGTMEAYAAAKARLLENQTASDLAILNRDDPLVREMAKLTPARLIWFGSEPYTGEGYGLRGDTIILREKGQESEIIPASALRLKGKHNLENVMAAVAAAQAVGISSAKILAGLQAFHPVPHRQEDVGTYQGISFINDSKGTNPDAALKALSSYDAPVILIAGGRNKGLDLLPFLREAAQCKRLILLGETADSMAKIAGEFGATDSVSRALTLEEAVDIAIWHAAPGDVVLLSPACTSWDMFRDYEERGDLFKTLVHAHYGAAK